MYLLDTNVISELRKYRAGNTEPNFALWAAQADIRECFLSVMTVYEIDLGWRRLQVKDPHQASIIRHWFDQRVLLDFQGRILTLDVSVMRKCATLHLPKTQSERDAFIGATALVHGLTVVTRNIRHFQNIDVPCINPWS